MLDDEDEEDVELEESSTKSAPKVVKDFEPVIKAAFEKELKAHTKNLEKYIKHLVENKKDELAAKYLGFDNKWGRWELDHCNGRAGESAAGDLFKRELKRHSEDIVKKLAGELPSLPEGAIKAFKAEFLQELKRSVSDLVAEAARSKARELVKAMLNDVITENDIKVDKLNNEKMEDLANRVSRGY
jgi:hypothetical protein